MRYVYYVDGDNTVELVYPLTMIQPRPHGPRPEEVQWDALYMGRRRRKVYTEKFIRYLYGDEFDIQPPWPKPEYTILARETADWAENSEPVWGTTLRAPIDGYIQWQEKQPWFAAMEQYDEVYRDRRDRKMGNVKSVALILRRIGYDLAEG